MKRRPSAAVLAAALSGALLLPAVAAQAADPATTDLVISQYVEGSSNNKAIEIYNGTGATVDLSSYVLEIYFNANATAGNTIALSGSLADGDVFVVADDSWALDSSVVDLFAGGSFFNGNDAVVLTDGTVVDSLGQIPTAGNYAQNQTLVRTDFTRDSDPTDAFTTAAFDVLGTDDITGLGEAPGGGGGGGGDDPTLCDVPADQLDLISEVQGVGDDGSVEGSDVIIRGVVTLADTDLSGYFVQEEPGDVDGDPATSEGIFVFDRRQLPVEGQTVTLSDTATEFNGLTQLSFPEMEVCDVDLVEIAPTALVLPLSDEDREAFESMLVVNAQDLRVGGLFTAYRFGELGLALDGPLPQPTSVYAPGTPEAAVLAELNAARELLVNDRDEASGQFNPYPWERFDDDLSAGDTMPAGRLVGVLGYSFGDFKIEPLDNEIGDPSDRIFFPETDDTVPVRDAPRLTAGNDVVSFNVLNYFNTFGDSAELRGAENAEDFGVQTAKIVDAIIRMDAAVYGLIELENDYEDAYDDDASTVPSVVTLVDALNDVAGDGTFAAVIPDEDQLTDDGFGGLGPDAIAVGFVYQPAKAKPVGNATTFDIDALLSGDVENNRWPLAQTFKVDKEFVEVVVNHFKSKGSTCTDTAGPGFDLGDDVQTVDTANCNLVREYASQRLVEWVADGATRFPTDDVTLIGDFNSYEEEEPIEILVDAGYIDLVEQLADDAFTYKFGGRYGRLDYAFANASLGEKVTDTEVWQINSRAPVGYLYSNDPIDETAQASSDHDPVIVSIESDGRNGASGKGRGPRG